MRSRRCQAPTLSPAVTELLEETGELDRILDGRGLLFEAALRRPTGAARAVPNRAAAVERALPTRRRGGGRVITILGVLCSRDGLAPGDRVGLEAEDAGLEFVRARASLKPSAPDQAQRRT